MAALARAEPGKGRAGLSARTILLTAVAMVAFAANSLLCRLALGAHEIDAASFTTIRVVSGVITLVLISFAQKRLPSRSNANWRSALALFAYMVFFSFAYISLGAANGALILFGAVQLTMFAAALSAGERFPVLSWSGLAVAVAGLVYLVSPGLSAPDPLGAALMAVAGIAWGFYSLLGRGAPDPLAATTMNFIYCAPLVVIVSLFSLSQIDLSPIGIAYAIVSGAIASGCGYVIWYAALRGLTAGRAATVQLSVPVIAAIGAAILLSEPITLRLVLASAATLGGVALVLAQRAVPAAKLATREPAAGQ
ncbi:MAG TPA: DMT family transporter [Candidatus Binatia bacterium]|nr:DMT family transporter [Candidatus Binatia bacterium]